MDWGKARRRRQRRKRSNCDLRQDRARKKKKKRIQATTREGKKEERRKGVQGLGKKRATKEWYVLVTVLLWIQTLIVNGMENNCGQWMVNGQHGQRKLQGTSTSHSHQLMISSLAYIPFRPSLSPLLVPPLDPHSCLTPFIYITKQPGSSHSIVGMTTN